VGIWICTVCLRRTDFFFLRNLALQISQEFSEGISKDADRINPVDISPTLFLKKSFIKCLPKAVFITWGQVFSVLIDSSLKITA